MTSGTGRSEGIDMEDPMTSMEIQSVLLDRVRVGVQGHISMEFIRDNTVVEADIDHLAYRMAIQLQSEVLAEKLPLEEINRSERVEFEVPDSWWQHLKADHGHRWWLRWLVRRRPVRTETLGRDVILSVSLQRYWAYPEAKSMPVDRFGGPVRIHTFSQHVDFRDLP